MICLKQPPPRGRHSDHDARHQLPRPCPDSPEPPGFDLRSAVLAGLHRQLVGGDRRRASVSLRGPDHLPRRHGIPPRLDRRRGHGRQLVDAVAGLGWAIDRHGARRVWLDLSGRLLAELLRPPLRHQLHRTGHLPAADRVRLVDRGRFRRRADLGLRPRLDRPNGRTRRHARCRRIHGHGRRRFRGRLAARHGHHPGANRSTGCS